MYYFVWFHADTTESALAIGVVIALIIAVLIVVVVSSLITGYRCIKHKMKGPNYENIGNDETG